VGGTNASLFLSLFFLLQRQTRGGVPPSFCIRHSSHERRVLNPSPEVGQGWEIRNPPKKNRPSPFCQAPQIPVPPLNPTKQTTNLAKISWPALHAINSQKRTIELVVRRENSMDQNIRKIVVAAKQSLDAWCPILAVTLFLRQGWDTAKAGHALVFAPPKPGSHRSAPPKNVPKSVAKARKTHQVTNPQHQPHQSHRRHFPQKTPHPPLFRPHRGIWHTQVIRRHCRPAREEIGI